MDESDAVHRDAIRWACDAPHPTPQHRQVLVMLTALAGPDLTGAWPDERETGRLLGLSATGVRRIRHDLYLAGWLTYSTAGRYRLTPQLSLAGR